MNDETLWAAFHARTLTHAEWTHRAHLRIAWMHIARYPLDDAHILFRIALIRLNTVHEVPESPQRGYHETLTRVWLHLVAALRSDDATSEGFLDRHAMLLDREAPLRHYTRERLFSVHARSVFVAPDREPLPPIG
jgi:hypothetical protein